MRLLPFLASAIVTVSLVTLFNTQLPVGGSKTPKLGYFLSPQQGFWKNAEKINTNFDAHILANNLKGKVDVSVLLGRTKMFLQVVVRPSTSAQKRYESCCFRSMLATPYLLS